MAMNAQLVHPAKSKRPLVPARKQAPAATSAPTHATCDALYLMILERAYELHVEQGHRTGSALDDWLEAEREILSHTRGE